MCYLSECAAPMGLTRSPPPAKECMVLAGNFINTAITQAKEIAKPLQINIKASDSVVKYSEILRRAPERITRWKASCARAGAINGEGTLRRCRHRHGDLWHSRSR